MRLSATHANTCAPPASLLLCVAVHVCEPHGLTESNGVHDDPLIIKAAARPDVGAGLVVITALGKIGPAAKDALPLLSNALQSPDPGLRRAAADAIAAIAKK